MANDNSSQISLSLCHHLLPPLPSKQANSPVVSAKHIDGILICHDSVFAAPRKKEGLKDGETGTPLTGTQEMGLQMVAANHLDKASQLLRSIEIFQFLQTARTPDTPGTLQTSHSYLTAQGLKQDPHKRRSATWPRVTMELLPGNSAVGTTSPYSRTSLGISPLEPVLRLQLLSLLPVPSGSPVHCRTGRPRIRRRAGGAANDALFRRVQS